MSSEVVNEGVAEDFRPYLGETLHRQDSYQEMKELMDSLAGEEIEINLIDDSSRGQGYSEEWDSEKNIQIEDIEYVGYELRLEPAEKEREIEFRTAIMLIKEAGDDLNLIFPNERMAGQRMIISFPGE